MSTRAASTGATGPPGDIDRSGGGIADMREGAADGEERRAVR
jgi:hypothetical protein